MEEASQLFINLLKRVWNYNLYKQMEWKGSWPDMKWDQTLSIKSWFQLRRKEEGAENLWRVHDKLYDLNDWIEKHPGGSSWISASKGIDITEAFECHHIRGNADAILTKYYVRKAKSPRNSPFTFHDDGLFRTLKREVKKYLEKDGRKSLSFRSKIYTDLLLVSTLLLAVLGAAFNSYALCILSGVVLCLLINSAHNYFHQKDNFRMYYFNLSLMSYRDWRLSHALSHHLYPNTRNDLEVTLMTPFLQWLPRDDKTFFCKYISWIYSPIVYTLIFPKQWVERWLIGNPDGLTELIPFVYPVSMYLLGGVTIAQVLMMWGLIILTASFTFGVIGVHAGHHHPDIFHDGDYAREDKDWGLYQLDSVRDRLEIKGSLLWGLITYGEHTLHHIFPTLDHADLAALYPVLMDVCNKFGFDFTFTTQMELLKGQFQQLARTKPKRNYKILNLPKNK